MHINLLSFLKHNVQKSDLPHDFSKTRDKYAVSLLENPPKR